MGKDIALIFVPSVNGLPGIEERHMEYLRQNAPHIDWRECRHRSEFVEQLPEARIAMVWAFRREWNGLAKKLTVLATPAAGKEWIEMEPRPGLSVSFGSFHGVLMAETVLAFMLTFARGIKMCFDRKDEVWPRAEVMPRLRLIRGKHAVILGFGNIGKWIGKRLVEMGVRVTGVNRTNLAKPDYFTVADRVVAMDKLDGELPGTDHLIVVLPGDSGTDCVVDARRLALLPATAHIYNVGRGNAIDVPALVAALKGGKLAGAGLDVFPEEPLPADSPILDCPGVVLLPHVSAFAPEYMDLCLEEFLSRLEGMRSGS